jgi:hypothetical protein
MPKTSNGIDQYMNVYFTNLVEPTLNTGIVQALVSSITAKDKKGMLIHRVDWMFDAVSLAAAINAAGDQIFCALSNFANNAVAYVNAQQNGIIDCFKLGAQNAINEPTYRNYAITREFPMPFICHPASLYFHMRGIAASDVAIAEVRLFYTFIELTDIEYQEMLQNYILQNIV